MGTVFNEKFPQSAKVEESREDLQLLGGFLEWLMGRYVLATYEDYGFVENVLVGQRVDIQKEIALFLEIDYEAYSKERERMYAELRENVNDPSDGADT